MEQIDLPELKEEELRAYFKECGERNAGVAGESYRCPIACFYKDKYGIDVSVDSFMIRRQKLPRGADHFPWSANFVRDIDRAYPEKYITGNEALVVLDKALIEAKEMEDKCQQPNPAMGI